MERQWWKEAVVYEIYPKSFMDSNGDGIGDIPGIISRLDYLQELGVTVLWLCPLYASPGRDNGYDISDYQAIQPEFGTMEDFDRLLAEAHDRGIRIVMDLVVNHTSDQHAWFIESRKGRDNPYRDYYIWRDGRDGREPNNWGSAFGGSAWQYDAPSSQYYLHQFAPEQADLNWENPDVRQSIYQMMRWWCDKGIDGFRMDVISMISKPASYEDGPINTEDHYSDVTGLTVNGPRVHEYLKEMNREVLSHYDLLTVGECSGVTIPQALLYAGTDTGELNMIFQFEHSEIDSDEHGKWTLKPMVLTDLKRALSHWQTELAGKAWNSLFWNNHDQPRIVSRWGNGSPEYRVLSAKMLATCLHMMQGTPYIYQGEELSMTNYPFTSMDQVDDIEIKNFYHTYVEVTGEYDHETMMEIIRRKGRDNARTPMQWDASSHAGFTEGSPWLAVNPNYPEINAASQIQDPDSIFSYYKELIRLRREKEVIVYGSYHLLCPEDEAIYAYTRTLGNEALLVVCSFSATTLPLPADVKELLPSFGERLIGNYPDWDASEPLRPYEALVLVKK